MKNGQLVMLMMLLVVAGTHPQVRLPCNFQQVTQVNKLVGLLTHRVCAHLELLMLNQHVLSRHLQSSLRR